MFPALSLGSGRGSGAGACVSFAPCCCKDPSQIIHEDGGLIQGCTQAVDVGACLSHLQNTVL